MLNQVLFFNLGHVLCEKKFRAFGGTNWYGTHSSAHEGWKASTISKTSHTWPTSETTLLKMTPSETQKIRTSIDEQLELGCKVHTENDDTPLSPRRYSDDFGGSLQGCASTAQRRSNSNKHVNMRSKRQASLIRISEYLSIYKFWIDDQ